MTDHLDRLEAGQRIPYGGDRVAVVDDALASAFESGDRLVVVQDSGALLRIPAVEHALVEQAVTEAVGAFGALAACSDEAITEFFDHFARRLESEDSFAPIARANAVDVSRARERGRSTTRLVLDDKMRTGMIDGLRGWRDTKPDRDRLLETIDHDGWSVDSRRAPLGVVGFVFEGRPNVFADACGVVRSGNSVVFRIGSDALGTARAIVEHVLEPALDAAGLPRGVVQLVDSAERSAGHALFSDRRLALAVARGSGGAVAELGAVARQTGVPVSLHGTGGAWIVQGEAASAEDLRVSVHHSLDRKVCNTVNVVVVLDERAAEMAPAVLGGLADAAAELEVPWRLHVVDGSEHVVPAELFDRRVSIERAEGSVEERAATRVAIHELGREWEWESSPEISLVVVDDVAEAVALCNRYSPRFVASLVSEDPEEQERFYAAVDAPFIGDGFTRWVDGQYALDRPELGLSNWEGGRMLARGAVLSGDSVHTVRYRATIRDPGVRR
jgi:glutamate-5-semialdehyde dehydrogenase